MRAYTKPKYGIQAELQEWYDHVAEQQEKKYESFHIFLSKLLNPYSPNFLKRIKIFLN